LFPCLSSIKQVEAECVRYLLHRTPAEKQITGRLERGRGIEILRKPEETQASGTRERASEWITEGQRVLSFLTRPLGGHGQLTARIEAAERKCEGLEQEIRVLRSEDDSFRKQRSQMADAFRTLAREVVVEPVSERV